MFKRKGGGVKGFLNNVKKTALFLHGGFPESVMKLYWQNIFGGKDVKYFIAGDIYILRNIIVIVGN